MHSENSEMSVRFQSKNNAILFDLEVNLTGQMICTEKMGESVHVQ